jgi:hypothetical protein
MTQSIISLKDLSTRVMVAKGESSYQFVTSIEVKNVWIFTYIWTHDRVLEITSPYQHINTGYLLSEFHSGLHERRKQKQ